MNAREHAAIYLRVSTADQDPSGQLGPCKAYAAEKGWDVYKVYIDEGRSAYKDETERPAFNELLEDAQARRFQHIVSFAQDRFSRQPPVEVLDLVRRLAVQYGVQVHAVQGDEWQKAIDVINQLAGRQGTGYMSIVLQQLADMLETIMRGAMAEQARWESRKLGQRVLASPRYQRALERGDVGRPAVDVPVEVQRRVRELIEEHPELGWDAIADQLNEEGYRYETKAGEKKKWAGTTLWRKLGHFKNGVEN
jgi:DNA invertase Pin-like site-specific DNA recombinase